MAAMMARALVLLFALSSALGAAGCASLQSRDPLQVTVAGIEPLQGQGMELRLLAKLRVQNPNDTPVDYNGVAVEMDVQGKTFGTGVSDAHGSVPRFGEAVIEVPITISAFRMARQALGMMKGGGAGLGKIHYELKGKLNGSAFKTVRFQNQGEFELPTGAASGT
jgi:LEA14-like dessication related protein